MFDLPGEIRAVRQLQTRRGAGVERAVGTVLGIRRPRGKWSE
jgi:hypothetical protein